MNIDLSERGIKIEGEVDAPYKIVVPLSGGKDSQACLMLALREYDKSDVLALFCDTGFEHPLTYQHVNKIAEKYGVDLVKLSAGTVLSVCTKYKRFPYEALALEQGAFDVWYGMRSDESKERSKRYKGKVSEDAYLPNDVLAKYPKKLGKLGVRFRLPILDWATNEVLDLLNGEENPLYSHGLQRVGCFPCLAGGEGHQVKAFHFDETGRKHFAIAEQISELAGRPVLVTNKYRDQGPGCAICNI